MRQELIDKVYLPGEYIGCNAKWRNPSKTKQYAWVEKTELKFKENRTTRICRQNTEEEQVTQRERKEVGCLAICRYVLSALKKGNYPTQRKKKLPEAHTRPETLHVTVTQNEKEKNTS